MSEYGRFILGIMVPLILILGVFIPIQLRRKPKEKNKEDNKKNK